MYQDENKPYEGYLPPQGENPPPLSNTPPTPHQESSTHTWGFETPHGSRPDRPYDTGSFAPAEQTSSASSNAHIPPEPGSVPGANTSPIPPIEPKSHPGDAPVSWSPPQPSENTAGFYGGTHGVAPYGSGNSLYSKNYSSPYEPPPSNTPPIQAPEAKKKRASHISLTAIFFICAVAAVGIAFTGGYYLRDQAAVPEAAASSPDSAIAPPPADHENPNTAPADIPPVQQSLPNEDSLRVREVFASGNPSTVAISTVTHAQNLFGQRFSVPAAGSGFIIHKDGYIMTNYHVISNADDIKVMLHNEEEYPAELVGSDPQSDLAVLKIKAKDLIPVKIGDSDDVVEGDMVVAIGNPTGEFANTLTAGYISSKRRTVSVEEGYPSIMMQTDASVSPGNSGGPLFSVSGNRAGQVIGVISAKSMGNGVEGIGFAIPINQAMKIYEELRHNGKVTGRAHIGIEGRNFDGDGVPRGVQVESITPNSAADRSGIKSGDVITAIDGKRTYSLADLLAIKDEYKMEEKAEFTVYRNNKELKISLVFDEQTEEPVIQQNPYDMRDQFDTP
ncbi:MAG: trypsin-like peptidase domain-containing protein [Oscillospiraceae bacterium]|nr:trypsin-like peptidase domain-containing protein [Oscillospiraceae bacterium]